MQGRLRLSSSLASETGYRAQTMRPHPWILVLLALPLPAYGDELPCSGSATALGCFDAAPFTGPAEPSPFRWFGRGKVLKYSEVASTVVVRYANAPAELVAPGSDPNGRIVPVVRQTTRADLRFAVGIGQNLDLTGALPVAIDQAGSGPDATTTQVPAPLSNSGIGDGRIALRSRLPESLESFDWTLRLEMTLPTGNERAYLGNRDFTEAVGLNAHWSAGDFAVVTDAGLRVSRPARFGDVNLGTHAFWGLGLDFAPWQDDIVHFAIEAMVRPMLLSAPTLTDSKVHAEFVMPTEWLGSVTSRPFAADIWFSVGAGTGLALSHRSGSDARVSNSFIAPTSPRYQLLASVALRM